MYALIKPLYARLRAEQKAKKPPVTYLADPLALPGAALGLASFSRLCAKHTAGGPNSDFQGNQSKCVSLFIQICSYMSIVFVPKT